MIIVLILLLLLLGGGGYAYRGPYGAGGGLGAVLIIFVILYLLGVFREQP